MLVDEHRDQILNRFERTSTSFRRTLTGLVGFAAAFFLVILVPYASIEWSRDRIPQQREELSGQIDRSTAMIDAIAEVEEGIKRLRVAIDESPARLASFIAQLNTSSGPENVTEDTTTPMQSPMIQQQVQQSASAGEGPCASLDDRGERTECLVHEQVRQQFSEYEQILDQRVVRPLKAIRDSGVAPAVEPAALEETFAQLRTSFGRKLEENPHFWYRRSTKDSFFIELADEVNQVWTQYGNSLASESEKLQREVEDLEAARRELEARRDALKQEEEEIEARLSQIQSPLGNLPVGLTESMLLFPLILAVGFLMLASQFSTTVRLRKHLHKTYERNESEKDAVDGSQVAVVAPLWIDPVDAEQSRLFRCAVLSIPFVIFAAACVLIIELGLLGESVLGGRPLIMWIYVPLYIASFVMFLYGFHVIRRAVRTYTAENRS